MGKRLLFLPILLVTSVGMSTTVVRSELACGRLRQECMARCIPGGTSWCRQCCKARGYVNGRWTFSHGEITWYCCKDVPLPLSPAPSPQKSSAAGDLTFLAN